MLWIGKKEEEEKKHVTHTRNQGNMVVIRGALEKKSCESVYNLSFKHKEIDIM